MMRLTRLRSFTVVAAIAALALFLPVPLAFHSELACIGDQIGVGRVAAASPDLPSLASNLQVLTFHASGQYTASKTNLIKFNAPFDLRVLYVEAAIQAKGGTQGTTTLTLNNAGNAVTNAMDLVTPAAATVVEATLVTAQQNVARDGAITADLVITGGSSPTIDNITLVVVVGRR